MAQTVSYVQGQSESYKECDHSGGLGDGIIYEGKYLNSRHDGSRP